MALTSAGLTSNDDVIVTPNEVEATEFDEECLVEGRLEVPIEGFERLALGQAASGETVGDAANALVIDLDGQNMLEQGSVTWTILGGPVEKVMERAKGVSKPEERQVSAESFEEQVVFRGLVDGNVGDWTGSVSCVGLLV